MTADRKAAGESSVHKGADGRWHGYVSMGLKEDGKRDRRHVATVKRADVVRRVRDLDEQRDAGITLASGRGLTVQQWMTLWLDAIASRKGRPSPLAGYRTCVNRISRHLGHHRLDKLQPEHLEAFYTRLEADDLSPTTPLLHPRAFSTRLESDALSSPTARLHHRVISRALKVAMQRGRVARNVATLVDAPTARREEVKPLTAGEAKRLLQLAEDLPNGARWSVALALGLRQGEAL